MSKFLIRTFESSRIKITIEQYTGLIEDMYEVRVVDKETNSNINSSFEVKDSDAIVLFDSIVSDYNKG